MNAPPRSASPEGDSGTRQLWLLVTGLTLVSLILKLHAAFDHPLWGDELAERYYTLHSSWSQLLSWLHAPSFDTPPLSFILYRLLVVAPGFDSELAWRLPGIVAGSLCVPVCFLLGRRLGSTPAALVAAAFCALDLNLGWNSQTARPYPFEILFLLSAVYVASGAVNAARLTAAILLFSAAIWTHLLAVVFVAGVAAATLLIRLPSPEARVAGSSRVAWSAAWALVANLPLLAAAHFLEKIWHQPTVMAAAPNWSAAVSQVRWATGLLTWVSLPLANALIFATAVASLGWTAWRRCSPVAVALLGGGAATLAGQFYLVRYHEFINPRYLLGVSPVLWFGAGALTDLIRAPAWRRVGACTLALLLSAQAWRAWHNDRFYGTVSSERPIARKFAAAMTFIRLRDPAALVQVLPANFTTEEAVRRDGFIVASDATPASSGPRIYLLRGDLDARARDPGQPTDDFIAARLRARLVSPVEAQELRRQRMQTCWTVWIETNDGATWKHF